MSFAGNQFYLPSSNSTLMRIMGTVDITVSIADDWTYLEIQIHLWGHTDSVHGTAVLGNDSIILAQLVSDVGFFDLSNGMLNNTTGSYNFTIQHHAALLQAYMMLR